MIVKGIKTSKTAKIVFITISVWLLFFSLAHFALAQVQPFGGSGQQTVIQNALGLGAQDPRVTVAKIIRVALGFLGIIAIGLVLYGGFLWLTSAGDASRVEKAKKLLISAGIGLLIILSAWGIVTFILSSLLSATGAPSTGSIPPGSIPGPGPGPGPAPISCDSDPGPSCSPIQNCPTSFYCDSACLCQPTGGVGDPCDADTSTAACEPDPTMCSAYLECDTGSCTCEGAPVIQWLNPLDGAVGNFVTIGGRYFGTTTGSVYFSDITGSTTVLAQFPNTVNPACTSNWSETQIIVVVPAGTALLSAVRVARADGQQDETDDTRGPAVDDFIINSTVRPGLCLANPASGAFNASFTLQGNNFNGAGRDVLFGSAAASTSADNVNFLSALSAVAAIPNIRAGGNTVFVSAAGESSNVLNFTIASDPNNDPLIDYLDPAEGPIGQYVTIYGRNFKDYQTGASRVVFENGGATIDADIDFPPACQNSWWRDRYIIVKVPIGVSLAVWQVSVTNKLLRQSNLVDFSVTTGPPGPGLCALVPHNGPVGQQVEAIGDYFGSTAGTARFYNNQPGLVSGWANQLVTSAVPAGAETGPFRAVDSGGNLSNSLNFTVGKCAAVSDCESGEECCGGGTFDGICRTAGSCGEGTLAACTFAWTFTTAVSTTTPATCAGYSGGAACSAAGACPNSPGQCQSSTNAVTGSCGDTYCNTLPGCWSGCVYDSSINQCKLAGSSCDQTDTTLVAGYTAECRNVAGSGLWQINIGNTSCPLGSYRDPNGWCTVGAIGAPQTCSSCSSGLDCQAGECVVDRKICESGSSCDLTAGSPTENECISGGSTCGCCCRVGFEAQDCCAGLTCEPGGCGSGPTYGQCTGCRVEIGGVVDAAASDAACNCTSGPATRYCDLTDPAYPNGVCNDVSLLNGPCNAPTLNGPFNSIAQATSTWTTGSILYRATTTNTTTWYTTDLTPNPSCDPTSPICGPGLYCGSSCICQTVPGSNAQDFLTGTELPCGCTSDLDCGDPSLYGCSLIDACCQVRPDIISTEPVPGEIDVCRNPLITATFDQEMDIQSFSGNVIVVGDYGTEQCPAGTNYLIGGLYKKYNFFSKLWFNLSRIFAETALALPGNFCAITGLVKGYNDSAGQGVLTFAPSAVLDADRDYFAIIKGDDSATASTSEGVLSRLGVGMDSLSSEDFNGITYQGYIWSFRTKPIDPGPPADDGICRLEYVAIEPTSYLFQSTQNNTADDGLNNSLDASTVDRDKQFNAYAKSSAGGSIVPITGYSWNWDWTSENESVARLGASTSPSITPAEVIVEAQNKKDAKTYLKVKATIGVDLISTPSSVGKSKSAKAPLYIFVCENPWPPVINPAIWPWQDTGANCTQETATCLDQNFELYYCRDKKTVGTANDLPAILVNPVVRGTPATPNQPLKELFFLREDLPGQANLTVSDQYDGIRVYASWPAVAGAASYKLYYGSASKTYSEVIETTATNYLVSGLKAGKKYYFAVTAIFSASNAESQPSAEVEVTPTDTTPPPVPAGFTASSTDRAVDLSWLLGNSGDMAGYYIYYGTAAGSYGAREAVNKSTNQATITGLTNGVTYYFVVGAYDSAGNEATTTPASATPS